MLSIQEKTDHEARLATLLDHRAKYTKKLTTCDAEDVEGIVEYLNAVYEGIRLSKKSLGHLKGIKKRKISMAQANKFRELYRETVAA